MNGHSVVFEQLVQKLEQITPNSSTLQDEQNEWSHCIVFGQLVQKLEQTTPNSSALQDDQNEWSQCSIWTVGSKVEIFSRTRVNDILIFLSNFIFLRSSTVRI